MTVFPKPLRAFYPDGGVYQSATDLDWPHALTAHTNNTLRVWRLPLNPGRDEAPYYSIEAVGMTADEVARAVVVARQMLDMPHNRKADKGRKNAVL